MKKVNRDIQAGTFFAVAGFVFILLNVTSSDRGAFLPIGIALVVIGIGLAQRGRSRHN